MMIRPFQESDFQKVRGIYQEGIDSGVATFEVAAPDWTEWDAKFLKACRLVAVDNDEVVGWAALSSVSKRPVYRGVAEVTIYVASDNGSSGVGTALMKALVIASEAKQFWTLQSSVFSENKASLRIHEKVGFREIGYRERIAQRDGIWKNTILLERRSNIVS